MKKRENIYKLNCVRLEENFSKIRWKNGKKIIYRKIEKKLTYRYIFNLGKTIFFFEFYATWN